MLGSRCTFEEVSPDSSVRIPKLTQCLEKYLLALKCILAAATLDREHSKLHEQISLFKQVIDKDAETLAPQTAQIIKSEFTPLFASTTISQYNDEYLSKFEKDCVRRTLSALKVRRSISPDLTANVERDAAALIKLPSITMEEAKETLAVLRAWKSSEVESFRTDAASKWPKAKVFAISG